MDEYSPDDELRDLELLFPPKPLMATGPTPSLRRSPRKKNAPASASPQKVARVVSNSPMKQHRNVKSRDATRSVASAKVSSSTKAKSALSAVPLLPRHVGTASVQISSNNSQSPTSPQRGLRLAHVDSLLVPLKNMVVHDSDQENVAPSLPEAESRTAQQGCGIASKQARCTRRPVSSAASSNLRKQHRQIAGRFVLQEARCNVDDEISNDEGDEEDTDLSGFIVDDDAELSTYGTSAAESGDDGEEESNGYSSRPPSKARRRRLQRGSPTRRRLEFESRQDDDEDTSLEDAISKVLHDVSLNDIKSSSEIEVIDLTSSPVVKSESRHVRSMLDSTQDEVNEISLGMLPDTNPFKTFDKLLKLSPPPLKPTLVVPSKEPKSQEPLDPDTNSAEQPHFTTPPATPPRSPSKLKSPSKLLSPSKQQAIPNSPHRQSMDAFWDHNVVNEWNDEYSPKKAPMTSPRKKGLGRFLIWSESEDEEDSDLFTTSQDSLPSPCSSPRKSRSPLKSPQKEEKKRLIEEKRKAAAAKKAFDSRKAQLAIDLLRELDTSIAKGQLTTLAQSTGGVKIFWSKTLRSTAGRANWKRTVTKLSGSPIKGNPRSTDPGMRVQHFASIELAEKIIDCEDRLVNTLAHEFCHLTNFMISSVRDQPHGASFKQWAAKVTSHLRATNDPIWQGVEVTTKHSYAINHKYLWVCVGRPSTAAMTFLNVEEDEGCGAEYGRHSKSIDTDKHRCGKCKGFLVQVRPKPRMSPKKKGMGLRSASASQKGSIGSDASSQSTSGLGTLMEAIELSD